MNLKTLKNILKHRMMTAYSCSRLGAELFDKGRLISSEWADEFKKKHYPAPAKKDACTYKECTICMMQLNGDKVIAELRIYDGALLDGRMQKLRCTYNFEVTIVTKELEEFARTHLRDLAEEAVEREDREIYELRVKAAKEKLIQDGEAARKATTSPAARRTKTVSVPAC